MTEKTHPKEPPSLTTAQFWKNTESLLPDIIGLVVLLAGLLLWAGFTDPAGGSFVIAIRRFFEQRLGTGRFLFVALLLGAGAGIFLYRYTAFRFAFRLRNVLYGLLVYFALLGLAAHSAAFSGGAVGDAIFNAIAGGMGTIFAVILLWAVVVGCFIALLQNQQVWQWLFDWLKKLFDLIFPRKKDVFSDQAKLYRANAAKDQFNEKDDELSEGMNPNRKTNAMNNPINTKDPAPQRTNQLPPLNLLEPEMGFLNKNIDVQTRIQEIEEAMEEFGTPVEVTGYSIGPGIIQYQVTPGSLEKNGARGASLSKKIRVGQVATMERDLAVRLGVANLSIQAPVPGESFIGIDLPNPEALKVRLRPLIESPEFQSKASPLNVALGRDISGAPVVVDLGQMPHLLIAGTTNSGKSICLRSMAVCLIMNNTPENLRVIMIDPKRVELFRFNGLPHLLGKVETEYERSISVLGWAVEEMKNRYKLFETVGVRKLASYNQYAVKNGQKPLPYIVIFIDELAEIMKGADKQGQDYIDTLASLARATGMHLVVATQRPDTTIITGKIKTNIPARIALNVASAIDSRVIMGKQGAEKLLGRGDMYFVDPSLNVPVRIQGPLLTDQEIDNVVGLWKKLSPKPAAEAESAPWDDFIEESDKEGNEKEEKLLKEAIQMVCRTRKASASYIQGKMNISFPKASRLLDRMEKIGVVGPIQVGGKAREVLWSEDEADSYGQNVGFEEED